MTDDKSKTLLEKLSNLDRRIIFLVIFIVVSLPMLLKLTSPVQISPEVQKAYDYIESIPAGGAVLFSVDYDATSMPEIQPMILSLLSHCFLRDIKVLLTGMLAIGMPLGTQALESTAAEYNKEYGVDYVNLGYRPGAQAVIVAMGREMRDIFAVDYQGTSMDDLPMMRGIHNYDDLAAVAVMAHGATPEYWIQFAQARYGAKLVVGTTAVGAPDYYNYLHAKQLVGLLGGMRGAAEYETLIKKPGLGLLAMSPQSWVHLAILALILLGNLSYILTKKRVGVS